jgi:hypothetical protein
MLAGRSRYKENMKSKRRRIFNGTFAFFGCHSGERKIAGNSLQNTSCSADLINSCSSSSKQELPILPG